MNPEVETIVKSKIHLIHLTYCHHNLACLKHAQNTISTKILATPYTVEDQLSTHDHVAGGERRLLALPSS